MCASQKRVPAHTPGVTVEKVAHKGAVKAPAGQEPTFNSCHPYSDRPSYPEPTREELSAPTSLLPPCAPTADGSRAGGAGGKGEGQTDFSLSSAGATMAGEVETRSSRLETRPPHRAGRSKRTHRMTSGAPRGVSKHGTEGHDFIRGQREKFPYEL